MNRLKQITIMLSLLLILNPAYSNTRIPMPQSGGEALMEGVRNGTEAFQHMRQIRMMQEQNRAVSDEKLFHYINSAQLGDPDSALVVGNLFNERIPYNTNKKDIKKDLISSFAWFQVSMMMGKDTYIRNNGDIVAMSIFLNELRSQKLLNKKEFKRADEMAIRICLNIPKCAQQSKHKG